MGSLETKKLHLHFLSINTSISPKDKSKSIFVQLQNNHDKFEITELQSKYLSHLTKNYSIYETVEHCMVSGIPVHFQEFYQLIIALWRHNVIQNADITKSLAEINAEQTTESLLGKITNLILPKTTAPQYSIEYLGKLPFFHNLPFKWLEKMFKESKVYNVAPQTLLVRQGAKSRDLYLLIEGTAYVYKRLDNQTSQRLSTLTGPCIYGEGGFFFNHPRSADIVSASDCKIAKFTYDTEYETWFKIQDEKSFSQRIWLLQALNQSELFNEVPLDTIDHILSIGKTRPLQPNEILFHENDYGDTFYILIQGNLSVEQKGETINTLGQGKCFGELSLLASTGKRTATIRALQPCLVYEISRQEFFPLLAKNLYLAKELERIAQIRLERDKKRQQAKTNIKK